MEGKKWHWEKLAKMLHSFQKDGPVQTRDWKNSRVSSFRPVSMCVHLCMSVCYCINCKFLKLWIFHIWSRWREAAHPSQRAVQRRSRAAAPWRWTWENVLQCPALPATHTWSSSPVYLPHLAPEGTGVYSHSPGISHRLSGEQQRKGSLGSPARSLVLRTFSVMFVKGYSDEKDDELEQGWCWVWTPGGPFPRALCFQCPMGLAPH